VQIVVAQERLGPAQFRPLRVGQMFSYDRLELERQHVAEHSAVAEIVQVVPDAHQEVVGLIQLPPFRAESRWRATKSATESAPVLK